MAFKGYGVVAVDVTVYNPTNLHVSDLVVRFSFWKPYTCPGCPPDFTSEITFKSIDPGMRQSKHIELDDNAFRLGYSQQFSSRFSLQIESYGVALLTTSQLVLTVPVTSTKIEAPTSANRLAVFQLVFRAETWESIAAIALVGLAVFFSTMIMTRFFGGSDLRQSNNEIIAISVSKSSPSATEGNIPPALNPDFMKYRDRLQEAFFAGEINEAEYVESLTRFLKNGAASKQASRDDKTRVF